MQVAYEFSKEKHGDILNGVREHFKRFRIYAVRGSTSNISVAISLFQCMQAVAKMGMNKGAKQNEVPVEVLKPCRSKLKPILQSISNAMPTNTPNLPADNGERWNTCR